MNTSLHYKLNELRSKLKKLYYKLLFVYPLPIQERESIKTLIRKLHRSLQEEDLSVQLNCKRDYYEKRIQSLVKRYLHPLKELKTRYNIICIDKEVDDINIWTNK